MILCRKRGFIKNNMSGEIDPVSRKIKTPITNIVISYENTNFRLVSRSYRALTLVHYL
jgi:hypothetical protein